MSVVAQENDPTLHKCLLLAFSMHVYYSIVHNSLGEFFTFKGRFYVPKNLVPNKLYEDHDAQGQFG